MAQRPASEGTVTGAGANVSALFTELKRHGVSQNYEKALATAQQILQCLPEDPDAYHCKITCLIHLGRFEDGLAELDKNPKLSSVLHFERAYIEYRLNKTNEAMKTLKAAPQQDLRCKELMAQLLYRLEDYSGAMDLYKAVIKNSQDDYDKERRTNLSAVIASTNAKESQFTSDLEGEDEEYELCYNAACRLIGQGDFEKAEERLRQAEELCRKNMAEDDPDVTEEDIEGELAMIRVQLAYSLQALGRVEDALKLYNNVLKIRPADATVMAVAANNVVCINKEHDIFDSKKKMKIATADGVQQKLTSRQLDCIEINQCLLQLHSNQGEACRKAAQRLRKKNPANPSPALVEAAQLVRDKRLSDAVDLIKKYVADYPTACSAAARLTLAQLQLVAGDVEGACLQLRTLGDGLAHRPAVVSAAISLYRHLGDLKSIEEVYAEATEWYEKHQPSSGSLTTLLQWSSEFHLKHQNPRIAAALLEKLRRKDPKNRAILGSLFAAYSQFDAAKAKLVSTELPSIEALASDVDVDALENAAIMSSSKFAKAKKAAGDQSIAKTEKKGTGDELLLKAKHKKKRKGKLPKSYDSNVDPDPERWLPRRERSYYKGKRKDKRKEIGKGSQGATSGGTDLDASAKALPEAAATQASGGSAASSTAPAVGGSAAAAAIAAAAAAKPQKPPAGAVKKKKKGGKGGKW